MKSCKWEESRKSVKLACLTLTKKKIQWGIVRNMWYCKNIERKNNQLRQENARNATEIQRLQLQLAMLHQIWQQFVNNQ